MTSIPGATNVVLTGRGAGPKLDALARSTKNGTPFAPAGRGSCCWRRKAWRRRGGIGREVGCTTGHGPRSGGCASPSSGWAGLDETGKPGQRSQIQTAETAKTHPWAVLDSPVPDGYARWTGPLIAARPWRCGRAICLALSSSALRTSISRPRKSWCESNDPRFCGESRRDRRALSRSAGKRACSCGR